MSREIKFRAWDYDTNTMIYPDSELETIFCFDKVGLSVYHNNGQEMSSFELMQYTGLKDRNGKEIYEGDIVRYFKDELGIVKFVAGSFIIDGNTCYESFLELGGKIAIVGNIYENPDLLEEEQLCYIMQE